MTGQRIFFLATNLYRTITAALIVYCLSIHFTINDFSQNMHLLSYFTLQSNMLCLIVFMLLIIKRYNPYSNFLIMAKGCVTIAILMTHLTFHYVMAKYSIWDIIFNNNISQKDLFAHYIVPLLVVGDWIIFQPKGLFKLKHIFVWIIFPMFYLFITFYRTMAKFPEDFEFPYDFVNPEKIGVKIFWQDVCIYALVFLSMCIIIVNLDTLMAKFGKLIG